MKRKFWWLLSLVGGAIAGVFFYQTSLKKRSAFSPCEKCNEMMKMHGSVGFMQHLKSVHHLDDDEALAITTEAYQRVAEIKWGKKKK